jgi:hypothetical protein
MNWRKAVGAIAPILGAAIPGPFGSMAVKLVTDALGIDKSSSDDEIHAAIQANPEALAKIKEAEINLKAKLKELGIKEKELAYKDTDSARKREVSLKDHTNKVLAFSIVLAWGVINWFLLQGVNESVPEPVLYRILGTLDAALMAVLYYYFGSSSGSDKKTHIMKDSK